MKLGFLTLIILLSVGCNNSDNSDLKLKSAVSLVKCRQLFNKGDYDSALLLANEIIRTNSNYSDAYLTRGDCYRMLYEKDTLKKNYLKSALDDYSKSIVIEPTADKYIARADFYFNTLKDSTASFRDFRQAIVDFEASNTNKFPLRTYLVYANCLSQTDRIDEAIEYYDEILTPTKNISGKPLNDIEINFVSSRLAELYMKKGDYLEALQILNKRTESYPPKIFCKFKLGQQEYAKKEMWKYGLECKANKTLRDKYFFELYPNEAKTPEEEEAIKKEGLMWPYN
jgi:tetratricopeptide (TPR) repeat protein